MWETLNEALTNINTKDDYLARRDARQAEQDAQREREQQQREMGQWRAELWACPSCGGDVDPGHTAQDGYQPQRGGLCPVCERARRELEAERIAAQERTGIVARLRGRSADR
ncbi:hypothetical protein [Streptomyces sp. NPDC002133]|uniref:hypothetical protein n=1 Tax=Streptomyces sp. NPDC002133 TaxID=3154409 RepID=UPI003322C013